MGFAMIALVHAVKACAVVVIASVLVMKAWDFAVMTAMHLVMV